MPHEVAYSYLCAAAEAFPFVSEQAYRSCTLWLRRTPQILFDPATKRLADEFETWLRPRAGGLSLDIIHKLCDHAWFDGCPRERSLADVLTALARRTLEPCGGAVTLCRDGDLPSRIAHFRWLSLLLPPDLLIAALGPEPAADRVSLASPQLTQVLREAPVAETHLHVGAALSFGLLWTGLMRSLAHEPPPPSALPRDPEPPPFGSTDRFVAMLTAAAIGRTLLAAFLARRERVGQPATLRAFFGDELPRLGARMGWPSGGPAAERQLRLASGLLVRGDLSFSLPALSALYRHLVGPPPRAPGGPLARALQADPLARWLPPAPGRALPETRFAARALAYLRGPGADDRWFARVFWQYERTRSCLYGYLVEKPGTAGLDWFTRHYDRISPFRSALKDKAAQVEGALALESSDLRLGALEVRWSPESGWAKVRKSLRDVAAYAAARAARVHSNETELAVVLHFLKQREYKHGAALRLHADPRQIAHGVRFGAWGYARQREAMAIASALEHSPELLLVLRGLDVAAAELAVPTWALIPALTRVQTASRRAAAKLARRFPAWKATPLHMTCHAGEDYRRLGEGLRRVHELIEFAGLSAGDRIGHGVCLGHKVERWALTAGELHQPAEERLDDLLWELDRYARGDFGVDAGRCAHARAEARRLGQAIYEEGDVEALIDARRARHDPRVLARLGFPFRRSVEPSTGTERLVVQHLSNPSVFQRGQRSWPVRITEGEIAFLKAAQRWLRREIGRLEITVESNPSSNLLIGDLLSIEQHPSFQMQPLPGQALPDGCTVLLSINADDPLTFATSLADEFAYVYGALLRCGVSAADALGWLAQRRDHGFRSRFALLASARPEALCRVTPGEPAR